MTTCLRETLADLRPSTKTIAEMQQLFGPDFDSQDSYGVVSGKWLASHALVGAEMWTDGSLVDIDDYEVRTRMLHMHAKLMAHHGVDRLDGSAVRSRIRPITQAISRTLWEEGAAGIMYRSNLDNRPCYALFEGRAGLYPVGFGVTFEPRILEKIARAYGLEIAIEDACGLYAPTSAHPTDRRGRRERRRRSVKNYSGPERRSGIDRRLTTE